MKGFFFELIKEDGIFGEKSLNAVTGFIKQLYEFCLETGGSMQ